MNAPSRIANAAVLSLLATSLLASCGSADPADPNTQGSETNSSQTAAGTDSAAAFTAGTYEATGQYPTPGGLQGIGVTISLDEDGVITDAEVEPKAQVGNSVQFQAKFAGGIASEVVGKSILELDVDRVSGSSLTSGGFNRAIEDIVKEAQE